MLRFRLANREPATLRQDGRAVSLSPLCGEVTRRAEGGSHAAQCLPRGWKPHPLSVTGVINSPARRFAAADGTTFLCEAWGAALTGAQP